MVIMKTEEDKGFRIFFQADVIYTNHLHILFYAHTYRQHKRRRLIFFDVKANPSIKVLSIARLYFILFSVASKKNIAYHRLEKRCRHAQGSIYASRCTDIFLLKWSEEKEAQKGRNKEEMGTKHHCITSKDTFMHTKYFFFLSFGASTKKSFRMMAWFIFIQEKKIVRKFFFCEAFYIKWSYTYMHTQWASLKIFFEASPLAWIFFLKWVDCVCA